MNYTKDALDRMNILDKVSLILGRTEEIKKDNSMSLYEAYIKAVKEINKGD